MLPAFPIFFKIILRLNGVFAELVRINLALLYPLVGNFPKQRIEYGYQRNHHQHTHDTHHFATDSNRRRTR